jgi:hypothetical protein
MWQANRALGTAGRLKRRATARTAREATAAQRTTEDAIRRRWGDVPQTAIGIPFWAEAVAGQQVDADPRVIEARQDAAHAHLEQRHLTARQADARAALRQTIGGGQRPSGVEARAAELRSGVEQARRTLAEIEALPVTAAAQHIRELAARATAERIAEATRQAQATEPGRRHSPPPVHQPGPRRDFGPSL